MSALFSTPNAGPRDGSDAGPDEVEGDTLLAGAPVVVRRRAGLAALIGAAASAVAIAYLWRASQTMNTLDWSLCAGMALVAAYYLISLVDARTPLAVADDLGVRIRLGDEWRGLPWDGIRQVAVHPRRGPLRDGRIVFSPHSPGRAVDGLEGKAKRHAALNQKLYGAALAVPVGVTTRISTSKEHSVVDEISALSLGRAEVIEVVSEKSKRAEPAPAPAVEVDTETPPPARQATASTPWRQRTRERRARRTPKKSAAVQTDVSVESPAPTENSRPDESAHRPRIFGGITTIVSRVGKSRTPHAGRETTNVELEPAAHANASPLRATRPALRAEVRRDLPSTLGNAALPESRELHRPGSVDLVFEPATAAGSGRVRQISQLGDPVDALVIDDFVTEPAYDPVIGPDLTAARTRLGLSVDELADRTRIRPHVIESIEVDDFAPCGGDFYARGHLRTLARVLGKDPAPFLAAFEERYASAPVNARRVFEAELATGMRGNMRGKVGGPNWGLLIGVVLCLILVWGVVRFFSAEPAQLVQNPTPVLNGSAGLGSDPKPAGGSSAPDPLPVTLVAAHANTSLVVRNGNGRIVFSGELLLGQQRRLKVEPPVRVRATDAGALEVVVKGKDKGVLGVLGEPGSRSFG